MKKSIVFGLLFGLFTVVQAFFPKGQWTGKFWDAKTGKLAATDGSFILKDGTWYNIVASNVRGKWFMKGDDIYTHAY